MLPLGLRVQNKLEALIDTHMQSLGKELDMPSQAIETNQDLTLP
jgi:hypothetical protein